MGAVAGRFTGKAYEQLIEPEKSILDSAVQIHPHGSKLNQNPLYPQILKTLPPPSWSINPNLPDLSQQGHNLRDRSGAVYHIL